MTVRWELPRKDILVPRPPVEYKHGVRGRPEIRELVYLFPLLEATENIKSETWVISELNDFAATLQRTLLTADPGMSEWWNFPWDFKTRAGHCGQCGRRRERKERWESPQFCSAECRTGRSMFLEWRDVYDLVFAVHSGASTVSLVGLPYLDAVTKLVKADARTAAGVACQAAAANMAVWCGGTDVTAS